MAEAKLSDEQLHGVIAAAVLDCLHYLGEENPCELRTLRSWAEERGLSLECAAFFEDWERFIRPRRG